jgi:hypothetical protein
MPPQDTPLQSRSNPELNEKPARAFVIVNSLLLLLLLIVMVSYEKVAEIRDFFPEGAPGLSVDVFVGKGEKLAV